jgi:hypothetical protein
MLKSSRAVPSFEVSSKNDHNLRIRELIEAIQILGSEKVEALRENLMSDLRNRLQSQIDSVRALPTNSSYMSSLIMFLWCSYWTRLFESAHSLRMHQAILLSSSFPQFCAIQFSS